MCQQRAGLEGPQAVHGEMRAQLAGDAWKAPLAQTRAGEGVSGLVLAASRGQPTRRQGCRRLGCDCEVVALRQRMCRSAPQYACCASVSGQQHRSGTRARVAAHKPGPRGDEACKASGSPGEGARERDQRGGVRDARSRHSFASAAEQRSSSSSSSSRAAAATSSSGTGSRNAQRRELGRRAHRPWSDSRSAPRTAHMLL